MREQNFSDERRGEMEGQSRGRGTVALYKQAQDCTLLLCYAQVSKLNVGSWTIFLLTFFNNMVFEVGRNCPLSRAWSMRTGEFPILALTLGLSVVSSSAVLKKRTLENGRKYFFSSSVTVIDGQRSMTCNRCHIRSLMDDGKVRNSSRTSVLTIEKSGE